MKTTEWDNHFPHFAPEEYFSPDGMYLFNKNIIPCNLDIMRAVEYLRMALNTARTNGDVVSDSEIGLLINHGGERLRGFVSPGEWVHIRSKREGQVYSFHLWCAADISSEQISSDALYDFILGHMLISGSYTPQAIFNCVIKYPWGVHVDLRQSSLFLEMRN